MRNVAALALTLMLALPAVAFGGAVGRAFGDVPPVTSEASGSECWTGTTTLVHFIVRNNTDRPVRYRVTVARASGHMQTWRWTVGRRSGALESYVIRKGETVPSVAATAADGSLIYWRQNVKSVARCDRR